MISLTLAPDAGFPVVICGSRVVIVSFTRQVVGGRQYLPCVVHSRFVSGIVFFFSPSSPLADFVSFPSIAQTAMPLPT